MMNRKDRIKKIPQKNSSSLNRNAGTKVKNPNNNTFFVTQIPKEKKINPKMNKTMMEESKTSSHRRLNKMDLDPMDDGYAVVLIILYV